MIEQLAPNQALKGTEVIHSATVLVPHELLVSAVTERKALQLPRTSGSEPGSTKRLRSARAPWVCFQRRLSQGVLMDGKGIPTTFKHRKIWRNSHLVASTLLTAELPCWDCWRSPSPTSCSGRISFGAVHARQEWR